MNGLLQKLGLVPFFTQQLADATLLQERLGRVMTVQRSRSTVACSSGDWVVELSPALRRKVAIDRPTVGDWVVLDESLSRIEKICPPTILTMYLTGRGAIAGFPNYLTQ